MPNEGVPHEVRAETPPRTPACLAILPNELLFSIIRFSIAVGREVDASALARTNSDMYERLNPELYKLVIKHRTFHILHWAAPRNQTATLKKALAHGADPNEMWTESSISEPRPNPFRPLGWGLDTAQKLDRAVESQLVDLLWSGRHPQPQTPVDWMYTCFSSPSLSLPNMAHLLSLWHHRRNSVGLVNETDCEMDDGKDDTRLNDLSAPLNDVVTFPKNMSSTDMDSRTVKIGVVQLFRQFNHPLHLAARHDRTAVTAALLLHGADVDSLCIQVCSCFKNKMPSSVPFSPTRNHLVAYTPLHVAICFRNYETAKFLVTRGARRMGKVFSGNDDRAWLSENALHTALSDYLWRYGINYDFVEFLLRHGYAARIEERNDENLTPLLIACNAINPLGRDDVVRLLLHSGAELENQGPCPPRTSFSGPFPNGGAVEWATPALWAARKGQFRLAKLLLDHGADLNTKSSVMRVTMLHAVCSEKDDQAVTQDRIDFLDYLLAKCTRKDLDTFDATGCTPLTMLIKWSFRAAAQPRLSVMESKLCTKGANMMAGIELGKVTPFETLIQESLSAPIAFHGMPGPGVTPGEVGNKVLAAMRLFRINQHPHRPTAFLNQFWGYMDRAVCAAQRWHLFRTPAVISCVLHGLIKAGFHPAEVDRHGDTAMTSFLRLLLDKPDLAVCDNNPSGTSAWFIQSIMALLQENGAALHVRNKEGYTAFGYLKKILEYDGDSLRHILLAQVVGHQVQPGQDEHGNMCFKFHPNKHLLGSLGGGSTLQTSHKNSSRWLVCEHWCRHYCGSSGAANGQCGCARTPFQTPAKCQGDCCEQGVSNYSLYRICI